MTTEEFVFGPGLYVVVWLALSFYVLFAWGCSRFVTMFFASPEPAIRVGRFWKAVLRWIFYICAFLFVITALVTA